MDTHTLCGYFLHRPSKKRGDGGEEVWFLALKIVISSFDGFFDYIPVGCDHHGVAITYTVCMNYVAHCVLYMLPGVLSFIPY